jgi:Ni,Fe-hydrogenase III small subunit/Pyruvate/2-oxoacid:ferredoxin oxidoreductase delta subunit
MLNILRQALKGGVVTNSYPTVIGEPADGFRGKPAIEFTRCTACDVCARSCPTSAIRVETHEVTPMQKIVSINYGDCIFCGECEALCPDTIRMTKEFQLATTDKRTLTTRALYDVHPGEMSRFAGLLDDIPLENIAAERIGETLGKSIRTMLGRSLHIREVDTGSCNGCEVEIAALSNPVYDMERFGIHMVASPRHADMLLVTGPVTRNMEIALRQTYEATPNPKIVVAVGACGIGGGMFGNSYASCGGVDSVIPVDAYIPGCPPRPEALLHGILVAIGRPPHRHAG